MSIIKDRDTMCIVVFTLYSAMNYLLSKKYSCLRCENKYKYKRELIQHQSSKCGVPPKFYCSECQKSFKQSTNYKLHMMKIHCNFNQY
ncbi:Uncharacterized protein FWK35_00013899 [Aphis craccivora]|uniref:C2H2-type domain-containing protein n=1 Tax=Aphis craccivora TaxID=307492 RepID=A0A6G0Z0N9_APHCR|nr:Uncharacterized protein FWK35_00013899 [Aphis craccivora]